MFSYIIEPCTCIDENTVACEDGICICKPGFTGSDCGQGMSCQILHLCISLGVEFGNLEVGYV